MEFYRAWVFIIAIFTVPVRSLALLFYNDMNYRAEGGLRPARRPTLASVGCQKGFRFSVFLVRTNANEQRRIAFV